jgi:hypothetical protein
MGMPNMKCMYVNIWIHHMQLDELFDFLNERIEEAPPYWLNEQTLPYSISGGYVVISLPYDSYSHLRSYRDWEGWA